MRLARFRIENYGPFETKELVFAARPGTVNLVIAPNGAGKSVLRQALRDLVFGIPAQSPMSFRFGYKGMRLLADVVDTDGTAISLGRRKGRGHTLIDEGGAEVPEAVLTRLTGGADDRLFQRLFCLDTHLLRAGGEELISSGGEIGEAVFAAGGGTSQIRAIREAFEKARDDIAPIRQTASKPFYIALDDHKTASGDLKHDLVRPEDWRRRQDERAAASARLGEIREAQGRVRVEVEKLNRIQRVRPWLAQHRAAVAELAPLADHPALPPGLDKDWQRAGDALAAAEALLVTRRDEAARLQAEAEALRPDATLLAEAATVDELYLDMGTVRSDHRDLSKVFAEEQATAALVALLERDLGLVAGAGLPAPPAIAAARDLIRRSEATARAAATAADDLAAAVADVARCGTALEALAMVPETANLTATRDRAQGDGHPARRMEEAASRLDKAEAKQASQLAATPGWNSDAAALIALTPPAADTIARLDEALRKATRALDDAHAEADRIATEDGKATRDIGALLEAGTLPEPSVIVAARAARDEIWAIIRRAKFGPGADPALLDPAGGEIAAAQALERGLAEADHLADRRDGESHRLARLAQLRAARAALAEDRARATTARAGAEAALEATRRDWASLTAGLGLPEATSASAVHEFLAARLRVADAAAEVNAARAALDREAARQRALAEDLAALLGTEASALTDLLAEAGRRLTAATELTAERKTRQAALDTARRRHAEAQRKHETATRDAATWQADWSRALATLGRPAGELAAATESALDLIEKLRGARRQRAEQHHRVEGMKRNIDTFETGARALAARLAPDLADTSPEEIAQALRQRLTEARRLESAAATLAPQVALARAARDKAAADRAEAFHARETLRRRIGGGDDVGIVQRLDGARARVAAEDKLTFAAEGLASVGDHWPLETLAAEVDALDAVAAAIRLDALEEEATRLDAERDDAVRRDTELTRLIAEMQATDRALDAEERRQQAGARLLRLAGDAMLAHGAAALLAEALERLRKEEDEDSLLARIGARFARLTGGAYQGVTADEDDAGRPRLLMIEADGVTAKRVDELSEGGRDQLFLALRLVMIEDYAGKGPALPFVADDLLQTSDETRSRLILEALADLSHHAQVIVLSHHEQVARIAEGLGDAVRIIRL